MSADQRKAMFLKSRADGPSAADTDSTKPKSHLASHKLTHSAIKALKLEQRIRLVQARALILFGLILA